MDKILFSVTINFVLLLKIVYAEDLKVCIPDVGCVKGIYMPGYILDKFEAYLGIPYAKPPIGNLRFKSPEPFDPWKGVLSAETSKPDCIQKNDYLDNAQIVGEEDCLYLNIYRPTKIEKPLPVMFYIYGGAFFSGSINPRMMDPAYIMDSKEVIVVMINYRVGPFGFLNTGTVELPGNYGLKDQRFALRWVQAHISAFGGDPQAVTLFGHSIGASSIHLHMLNDESKDLFQRAILASGGALGPYGHVIDNPQLHEQRARDLAVFGGYPEATNFSYNELVEALQSIDPRTLIIGGDKQKEWHQFSRYHFRAAIEQADWPDAFLIGDPEELMKNGKWIQVPNLNIVVPASAEGVIYSLVIWAHDELREEFNAQFDERLWQQLEFSKNTSTDKRAKIINSLVEEYMDGVHELNNSTLSGLSQLFGDFSMFYPNWKCTKYYVQYADPQNPLYNVLFNYRGPNSYEYFFTGGTPIDYGVTHLDDNPFLFRQTALFPNDYPKKSADARFLREWIEMYVDFVKSGQVRGLDPCTEANSNELVKCDFLEMRNQEGEGFEKILVNGFNLKRLELWDKIYNSLK